tara:strand:+ start:137 stop:352 length:216 start_codon:yes stop_codon:yes gene_type:complete
MPNTTPQNHASMLTQQKFTLMVQDAFNEEIRDLPALQCDECNKCATFGGKEFFLEYNYTINDICTCNQTQN